VAIISGHAANGRGKDAGSFEVAGFIGQPYQLKELAVAMRCMLDEKKMKLNLNESSRSSFPFCHREKHWIIMKDQPRTAGCCQLEGGRGGK